MSGLTLADFPASLLRAFAVAFGLVWGSFLNVVIHRLPREMSIVRPASHCPSCQTPIKFYRNIPVLSWLLMRGRASCCGFRIPARYPIVELAGGILSVAVLEAVVMPRAATLPIVESLALYLAYAALCLALVAATFIDLEHMIIPDSISLGGTVLGLGTYALRGMEIIDALVGTAAGFFVVYLPLVVGYRLLRGRPGMGLGDAKLLMLAGAWLGWGGALLVLGAAAIQGTLVALVFMLIGKPIDEPEAVRQEREEIRAELEQLSEQEREEIEKELALDPLAEEPEEGWGKARIAFGPFLILAILECLLIGPDRIIGYIVNL